MSDYINDNFFVRLGDHHPRGWRGHDADRKQIDIFFDQVYCFSKAKEFWAADIAIIRLASPLSYCKSFHLGYLGFRPISACGHLTQPIRN